jgi:hypothetical protein
MSKAFNHVLKVACTIHVSTLVQMTFNKSDINLFFLNEEGLHLISLHVG